jgi:TM2 domain-containing membrane protein YozV
MSQRLQDACAMNKKWLSFLIAGGICILMSLTILGIAWRLYLEFGFDQDTFLMLSLAFLPLLTLAFVFVRDKDFWFWRAANTSHDQEAGKAQQGVWPPPPRSPGDDDR